MDNIKKISIIVALAITLAGVGWSGVEWERRLAYQEDVQLVAMRLDQKIVADRIHNLQSRIWMLEDRFGGVGVPTAPPEIKAEYRALHLELEQAKRKLTKMGG